MNIQYEHLSETGLKRKNNQDSITAHVHNNLALFAVADGMGGHSQGEYASQKTIAALDEWWNDIATKHPLSFQERCDSLINLLEQVNSEIHVYASSQDMICGSTISILLVCEDMYAVINVGDSPVFYVNNKYNCHASTEHSYDVILQKSLENETYIIDEQRVGRLVQALGVKEKIYPNIRTGKIDKKHVFMLCSDGISKYYSDKEIFRCLKKTLKGKTTLQNLCNQFKEKVFAKGASDNLSEIVVSAEPEKSNFSDRKKVLFLVATAAIIFVVWVTVLIMQMMLG